MNRNRPPPAQPLEIVERISQREGLTPEMTARFAVGLKLMGEVMLENREHPLFAELKPHFMEMMKIIKGKKPRHQTPTSGFFTCPHSG